VASKEESEDLKDISFGALAKAQAALAPITKKRKFYESVVAPDNNLGPRRKAKNPEHEDSSSVKPKKINATPGRTSKHAPAIQSSRHAVSRRRDIFDPPASLKSRDPRFDPTVTASNSDVSAVEKANKNYSFLTSYQASEILDLKAQIKKSKDPDVIAALKRQVMSLDSKIRAGEAQQRERDIVRRHKQKEKEAIKSGQKSKPYFLKRSEMKKEALAEKFESMGKKARDKAMERKRKRVNAKESRGMPRFRRERLAGEI
jgi:ribosomal RNA-processing protein 36